MQPSDLLESEDAIVDLIKQMTGANLNSEHINSIRKAFRIMKPHLQRAGHAGQLQKGIDANTMNDIVSDLSSEFQVDPAKLHQNIKENKEKINFAFTSAQGEGSVGGGGVGLGGDIPLVPDQNTKIRVIIDGQEVDQSGQGEEKEECCGKQEECCGKEECCSDKEECCSNKEECCSNKEESNSGKEEVEPTSN